MSNMTETKSSDQFTVGEIVKFTQFDGGQIVPVEGKLVKVTPDKVKIRYEGLLTSFHRAPGSKSGWGVGHAKSWRLDLLERKKFCHPDVRWSK